MEENNSFDIQKEEYLSLRKEIENYLAELASLERNCVIAVATAYTWIATTTTLQTSFARIAWWIPVLLPFFGGLRSLTIGKHLRVIGNYIRLIETKILSCSDHKQRWGWEHFFLKHGNTQTTCLRILFWVSFFVFSFGISSIGYSETDNQNSSKNQTKSEVTLLTKPLDIQLNVNGSLLTASTTTPASNADIDRVIGFLDSRLPTQQEWHNLIDATKKPSRGETASPILWLWIIVAILIAGLVAILIWPKKKPENEFSKRVKVLLVLLPLIPVISPSLKDFATAWRIMWPLRTEMACQTIPLPPCPPSNEPLLVFPFLFDFPEPNKELPKLNQRQVDDLTKILSSVKACARKQGASGVELEVQGFADSNQFPTNNKEQNLALANQRAKELHSQVTKLLKTESPMSEIDIKLIEWKKIEEMEKSPRYLTTKPIREAGRNADQGYFNRRAEIRLLKAGDCSP